MVYPDDMCFQKIKMYSDMVISKVEMFKDEGYGTFISRDL